MAACMLSRLALRTVGLSATTLRRRPCTALPCRSFSASSCILGKKWFTEKHEWIEMPDSDGKCTVGITNYAQDSLGEIVYVELPEVGADLEKDDIAGCVESVKAASDIFCPLAGVIADVNEKLVAEPKLINNSPLKDGWLFKLEVKKKDEVSTLMDEGAYKKFCEEQ